MAVGLYELLFLNIEEGEEKLKINRKKREVTEGLFQFQALHPAVMRSIASLAASCSASFFRWAVPVPRSWPEQLTPTVKLFSCSAPVSVITV